MFARLEGENRDLLEEVLELVYFMRGAVPYEQMMRRTYGERQLISTFLKDRLEKEMQKMTPVY